MDVRAQAIAIGIMAAGLIVPMPRLLANGDHCEVVGCWQECHAVPGGRRCQNFCRRRCWRSPPRYDPPREREYDASPPYIPPVHRATPQIDHGLLLLGGAAVLIILIVVAASASRTSQSDIHDINADIEKTNQLTSELEAAARQADAHIAAAIARARHGGRNG
jgi:hypothetical protein